jgi:hypothetical protein
MAAPRTTLLCAIRFWAGAGFPGRGVTSATLRRGVRHVARKQGITPRELDAAERSLVRRGLAHKAGKRSGAAIGLTEKGLKLSSRVCRGVSLAPWDAKATFPFAGARRRKHRRR